LKIITLVENNSTSSELQSEHGLSLYIETASHKILFDLGASSLFAENAEKLGVNLKNVDIVIISHGHYDHGGGLNKFLSINSISKIYININAFGDYYSLRPTGDIGYIGLDKTIKDNERIIFTENYYKIDKCLELFSDVRERILFSTVNKVLKKKIDEKYIDDDFIHEQNLIITENGKTVLFAGCAHNGIINIINKSIVLKGKMSEVVIGGFHLTSPRFKKNEDVNLIEAIGETLIKYNTMYYTCHCTGEIPYKQLKEKLCNKIEYISIGSIINID